MQTATVHDLAREAKQINEMHAQYAGASKMTLDLAQQIGQKLIDVKASLKHGQFMPWVKDNCAFAYNTAKLYMNAAKKTSDVFLPDTTITDAAKAGAKKQAPVPDGMVKVPSFTSLAVDLGALPKTAGGLQIDKVLAAFEEAHGAPYPKKGHDKVLVTFAEMEAIKAVLVLQAKAKTAQQVITEVKADLKPTAQQKLDKALAVALAAQKADAYTKAVEQVQPVKEQYLAKAKHLDTVVYAELMETKAEVEAELTRVQHQRALSANTHISGEEFQFLLQATHPDKFTGYGDPALVAKMQKVFAILQKLAPALNTKMQTKKMIEMGLLPTLHTHMQAATKLGDLPSTRH